MDQRSHTSQGSSDEMSVVSWQRTFSFLLPWKKGKGSTDAFRESEVVLTKIKLGMSDDSAGPRWDRDPPDPITDPPDPVSDPSGESPPPTGLHSDLPKRCRSELASCEVELLGRSSSPSTVHSWGSSCSSSTWDLDKEAPSAPRSEGHRSTSRLKTAAENPRHSVGGAPYNTEAEFVKSGHFSLETCEHTFLYEAEFMRRTATRGSVERCRNERRRHYEEESRANPVGSGLDYLEHVCQLLERIGRLQEANLQLQHKISTLQRNGRRSKTKESSGRNTWGRMKDLMRKIKLKKSNRLGGTSNSWVKSSCPQLHRPDLEPMKPNRKSMIAVSPSDNMDWPRRR